MSATGTRRSARLAAKGQSKRPAPLSRSVTHHPPEVLCQIFHYAVEGSGTKKLLPILHVCCQWRHSALGDSSLWNTIYLSDTTPPLFDMALIYAGERPFKVHLDNPDIDRVEKLWKFVDRIEELDCWFGTHTVFSFLASLGAAQNLKVFRLRDGAQGLVGWQPRNLLKIFQGHLPSLRELSLSASVIWPTGLFKNLRSFEFDPDAQHLIPPIQVLDVLRESPLLETLRLVGHCDFTYDEPPKIALPLLKNCTLIGNGAIPLISYLDIPASTNVFISTPPLTSDKTEIYPFDDISLAPYLHVLEGVSTVSFVVGFDTIKLRAQNDSGGALDIQVYYHENVMAGLAVFAELLKNPFRGVPCRFQTTKEFTLHIERGASRDDAESVFCAVAFSMFISGTPSLERVELRGVPPKSLTLLLRFLHKNPHATIPFQNLQRLYVESTPLHSPKSLLEDLDKLLKGRSGFGLPLQFLDAKVNCETLIPMADHSTFLTAWGGLVGEDVRVAYSRDRVEKLPRRGLRLFFFKGEDENGWIGGEASAVESGSGSDLDWEAWISGEWPKAASEMKGSTGT